MRPAVLGRAAVVVAVLALGITGCAGAAADRVPTDAVPPVDEAALTGELTVYAAASLKGAFDELATDFERQHPSLHVQPVTYDGSSTLATQIIEGAPADVFASADEKNMGRVVDEGLASGSELFASNTLVLVVPAANPADVTGLDDLADPDLTVVLCAAEVPCGAASTALLANAGVTASVDSYEQNLTAVLTKVAAGEADAGLVYVTDATADGVETVEVAGADAVVNHYPIAALTDSGNPEAAAAFVAFVRGDAGRAVLASYGFGAP